MQLILFLFFIISNVYGRKFVLLDPDDPNLETVASNITDADIRAKSLKMAKFRKWLKYDVDCEFIPRHELEVKISQGKCPFQVEVEKTTTTTKEPKSFFLKRKRKPALKTDKSIFSHENKETVVRAIVGNNKMQDIDWTPTSFPEIELIGGSMVTFKCDEESRKKHWKKNEEIELIEWFVNGKRIDPSWFDWRVSVSINGRLGIWPIGVDDSGHFECLANGQLRASVTVKVIPVSNVLIKGLLNYLLVCAIFAVATISIGCLLGNRNQEIKEVEVDRMEEFLAENVFKTDQMAKERVAEIINKQGLVDERHLIENKAKSNRSTIMILLQKPVLKDSKNKNEAAPNNATTTSTDTVEGTTTVTQDGTSTGKSSDANETKTKTITTEAETTTGTSTGVSTEATEAATTVTKTEEEDVGKTKKEEAEKENSEDEDDDEDGGTGASSNGSTATSKASKGPKKGKMKKKGSKNKKTNKKGKKVGGKGKKNTKQGSKAKGGGKGASKNTKNKKTVSKPAKKNK